MIDRHTLEPRRYAWFQFDLRTLLFLVLVVAAVAAPFTWKAAREQREARKFQAAVAIGSMTGRDGSRGNVLRVPDFGPHRFQLAKVPVGVDSSVLENIARLEYCEKVILRAVEIADADMSRLRSLKGVRFLDLRSTNITDKGLLQLARFDALEELILDHTSITDNSISTLTNLPRLQKVSVCGTHISATGAKKLADRKLKVAWATAPSEQHRRIAAELERHGAPVEACLNVSHVTSYSLTVTEVPFPQNLAQNLADDILQRSLKSAHGLEITALVLELHRSLQPPEYELLSGLQGLKQLTFNGGNFYRGAANLGKLNNLEILAFNKCVISDKQLPHISELVALERLVIDNPQLLIEDRRFACVSDHGLVHLQKLRKLHTLALRNIGATISQYWVDQAAKQGQAIDELRLTDAGLEHLTVMESLQSLDLSKNSLTAVGLMKLARLKNLRELILVEIPLTPQEKSELKNAFPQARLVFE